MPLIVLNNSNENLLSAFISNELPSTFRYFKHRDTSCMKNHLVTLIYTTDDGVPVGYGHLDYEISVWLGICVLEKYQNKGIGGKIMRSLISYAVENTIQEIVLTVDSVNSQAITMYKKYGFEVTEFGTVYKMRKII